LRKKYATLWMEGNIDVIVFARLDLDGSRQFWKVGLKLFLS